MRSTVIWGIALAVCTAGQAAAQVGAVAAASSSALPAAADTCPVSPHAVGPHRVWLTLEDYPTRALRMGWEGLVCFTVTVGADGIVKDCAVTQSSGHDELDQATCSMIMRRARFGPATDDLGHPVEGHWSNRVNWKISH